MFRVTDVVFEIRLSSPRMRGSRLDSRFHGNDKHSGGVMRKNIFAFICFITIVFVSFVVYATTPMITSIPNQYINMNQSTPTLSFTVMDNEDSPGALTLSYKSSNRALVPATDANIILGGSVSGRTVKVIPAQDKIGTVVITIIVTDTSGDQATEDFAIEVAGPPITS